VTDPVTDAAPDVEIFDPPLCCPTGLCGPVLDTTLVDLSEALLAVESDGLTVARHQIATEPQAFMRNADVYRLIRERQLAVLPITVVRGRVVKTGAYPTLKELEEELDAEDRAFSPASSTKGSAQP
jgi:hypothetical protein